MGTYPNTVRELLRICREYRRRAVSLGALKQAIWTAADNIVDVEERETRDFLLAMEGSLDTMEYTTDSDLIFGEALKFVQEIEKHLRDYLPPGSGAESA